MKKIFIYLFLFVFFQLCMVSAINENQVWVTVEIINTEQPVKVGDSPYYKINITNLGDTLIEDQINISLENPLSEEVIEIKDISIPPYSQIEIIQKSSKENEHGILKIDKDGTFNIKIVSYGNLDMYKCDNIYNLTTTNLSKDFCLSGYKRWFKEIKFPFEVLPIETKSFIDKVTNWIKETDEKTVQTIEIAEESKKVAYWSFYLVLLTLLISFFNKENVLFIRFEKSFLYKDLSGFFRIIEYILKPIIRRKRFIFYSFLFLFIYLFYFDRLELIAFLAILFWIGSFIFYLTNEDSSFKGFFKLVGFFFLIYLSWRLIYPYYGYSDPLMFVYTPILTQIFWILLLYLKDFLSKKNDQLFL